MNCNCQWVVSIFAVVILVFAFWTTAWSKWVILIAAILILLHAWTCKNCKMPKMEMSTKKKRK